MMYIKTSLPLTTLTQRINNRAGDPDFPIPGLRFIGATANRAAWVIGNCAILALGDDAGATLRLRITMPMSNGPWGIGDTVRYAWDEILSDLGEVTTDTQKHVSMLIPVVTGELMPRDPEAVAREWLDESPTATVATEREAPTQRRDTLAKVAMVDYLIGSGWGRTQACKAVPIQIRTYNNYKDMSDMQARIQEKVRDLEEEGFDVFLQSAPEMRMKTGKDLYSRFLKWRASSALKVHLVR